MAVYFSVLIVCCMILFATRNDTNPKGALITVFSIIWCMITFQRGWGGDYDSYVYYFDLFRGMSFTDLLSDESHGELGYKILLALSPTMQASIGICMAIYLAAVAFLFYHFIPRDWWPLALIFFFLSKSIFLGAISSYCRNSMANAFLISGIYALSKEKRWFFILAIVAGAFFHKSLLFLMPLVFIKPKELKFSTLLIIGIFAIITILSMMTPGSWTAIVENVITGFDVFESYETYLEDDVDIGIKGISLLFVFYWIYLLANQVKEPGLTNGEYIVLYLALMRIAIDLLPAVGLSTRAFYFLDYYFYASMMIVLSHMVNRDNRIILIATLLIMFIYFGFYQYYQTPFFKAHWAFYHFIF